MSPIRDRTGSAVARKPASKKAAIIFLPGEEVSYLLQQVDVDGAHDITRPVDSPEMLKTILVQYGFKKLGNGQRLVQRIDRPISFSTKR